MTVWQRERSSILCLKHFTK